LAQSVALYRKWRPLTFDQVIGQEHITTALRTQVEQERVSHAYIFTGTRGTGKTTCAKILARAVCCENPKNGEPCNSCPSCLAILSDSTSDCSEIDAASNTGVDNIRSIREEALYTPTMLRRRIFIIDEVHMLSTSAFNALLKIMEEPPAHVLFILATTDIHKVPATILSRCQRFDFRRVSVSAISQRLMHIAQSEGYSLTEQASRMIARIGDGSVRDSISLYDRCMPYSGTVDEERVTQSLGLPESDAVTAIYESILSGDPASALEKFLELYANGKDIIAVFDSLLSLIRDIDIAKLTKKPEYLTANSMDRVKALSDRCDVRTLEYHVSCVSELLQRLTRTAARRADGEVCLFKMALGCSAQPAPVYTAPAPAATAAPVSRAAAPTAPASPAAAAPAKQTADEPVPAAAPVKAQTGSYDEAPPWDDRDAPPESDEPIYPESEPAVPAVPARQPAPAPAPARSAAAASPAPAPSPSAAPEQPKRTSVSVAPSTDLKKEFVAQASPRFGAGVRTYLALSDITPLDRKIRIEAPDEALGFLGKPAYMDIYREIAQSLGYEDVMIVKKAPQPPTLSPIDVVLNNARSLGIPIEQK